MNTLNKITVIAIILALSFFAMPVATLLAQGETAPAAPQAPQPVAQAPVPAEQPTNQTPEPLISELPVVELPPAIEQEGSTITEPIEPVDDQPIDVDESPEAVPSVDPDADPADDDEKAANDAAQLNALYAAREQLTTTYYALLSERDRVQRGRATSLKFMRLVLSPAYFLYREIVDPNEISTLDQQIAAIEARLAALNRAIDRIVQRNQ